MTDDIERLQRQHLQGVLHWARRVRETLDPVSQAHLGDVHFRPGSRGVAMVGLLPERPQRGKSGLRDLTRVAAEFPSLFSAHCRDVPQGRPTPEKRLQSWMTAEAYRNDRIMASLDRACPGGTSTRFVADELALPVGDGRRIVCDMLALRQEPDGSCRAAVIELKSARQLKRLVEQVQGYARCVDQHRETFSELFSEILGTPVNLTGSAEAWIVWPQAGEVADPRADELAASNIRVVGYLERDDGFVFRVEPL